MFMTERRWILKTIFKRIIKSILVFAFLILMLCLDKQTFAKSDEKPYGNFSKTTS